MAPIARAASSTRAAASARPNIIAATVTGVSWHRAASDRDGSDSVKARAAPTASWHR